MDRLVAQYAALFPDPEKGPGDRPLCAGGDLHPARLLAAYSRGIFPWYDDSLPILWWSPDPRCVLPLESFRLPARSARALRRKAFTLTLDAAFGKVIRACAGPRHSAGTAEGGTWITPEMLAAYENLHALGFAHSVEAWYDGELAGGLYGVALGRAFFGESMFCRVSEASRAALAGLVALLRQRGAILLDCQQETPHIMRMGGRLVTRTQFLHRLREALAGRIGAGEPWGQRYAYSLTSGSWTSRS